MVNAPLTVTELTARIKQVLEQGFANIKVSGEISRLTTPSSGHIYFTIKDSHAAISAVVWRSAAARLNIRPKDGQAYIFSGHLSLYEPRGSYQLIVTHIMPAGVGRLAEEFEKRKLAFATRGWFDESRKQSIPKLPQHIGIVTSQTAAAFEDVKKVLQTRPAWLRLTLSQAIVQGESAPQSITHSIHCLHQLEDKPDVILLVRGGGSIEDLWCFNDEKVVQAIVDADIPIITGIGHEIDTTLADLAADVRAATPSNAAELVCPAKDTLRPQLTRLKHRLNQAMQSYKDGKHWALERANHELKHGVRQHLQLQHLNIRELKKRLQQFEPNHRLRQDMQHFYQLKQRLLSSTQTITPKRQRTLEFNQYHLRLFYQRLIQRKKEVCSNHYEHLHGMNPKHVLRRGYAMTTNEHGTIVSSAKDLKQGDKLQLHFHDGTAETEVKRTTENP